MLIKLASLLSLVTSGSQALRDENCLAEQVRARREYAFGGMLLQGACSLRQTISRNPPQRQQGRSAPRHLCTMQTNSL